MKDEKYTPEVGSWLKGREAPHPDSQQTAHQVAARLPHVRQRGRWWPLPSFRRPPSTDQMDDNQPASIPAPNGHTPTVTGRTQPMFSPVKAITAGALVFAIGGVLLIAQPFDQQGGSVPGAATDAEPAQTVEVTGQVAFAHPGNPETWTTNDPRLTGTGSWVMTEGSPVERVPSYFLASRSLETDDGTWRQLPVPTVNIPGDQGNMLLRERDPHWDMVLVGEGGYEGLVFVAKATWTDDG